MDKIFTSISDQIQLLKSRGMIITDEAAVEKILLKENYYNLINGYKSLFLDPSFADERYLPGTYFEDIYSLYLFDRELRNLFMRFILEIENNVKSVLAYKFSENYGHDNYLKIENFDAFVHPKSRQTKSQAG